MQGSLRPKLLKATHADRRAGPEPCFIHDLNKLQEGSKGQSREYTEKLEEYRYTAV